MFTKSCKFCKKIINTIFVAKRFCDSTYQRRNYNSRDDIKKSDKLINVKNIYITEENKCISV